MDNILCILLLSTAFFLGIVDSADSCQGGNCNSTDTDANAADKSEVTLYSLDQDLRELYLDGCSNLTVLELTPNLRTLEIFNCSWEYINISKLSAVANLSSLKMQGGGLSQLDSEQFVELPHLQILELGGNNIKIASEDTFKGVSQLWMLTLNDNRIVVLPENLFNPLPELRHLDLSNNRINGIPESIFANNPKLQVLALRHTRFLGLSPKVFETLKSLIFLDLSSNYFREVQLHSAESIRLEDTGMHSLEILGKFSKLQARSNYLEDLHFENKDPVTELDLHENSLETDDITVILQGMWRLQRLDISKNVLMEMPIFTIIKFGEVFLLPSLRFVNMSRNYLIYLRADSPLLSPSLTHLDLSYNRIRRIEPDTFSLASKLQSLHLEGNQLKHFQFDLFYTHQRGLKEVAIYNNDFSHEIYEKIAKYFTRVGILVLEKNNQAVTKIESLTTDFSFKETLVRRVHTNKEHIEREQRHTLMKWKTWNVLIFLSLVAAVALNVSLILKHLRSSGKRAWRLRQCSKVRTRVVNI